MLLNREDGSDGTLDYWGLCNKLTGQETVACDAMSGVVMGWFSANGDEVVRKYDGNEAEVHAQLDRLAGGGNQGVYDDLITIAPILRRSL